MTVRLFAGILFETGGHEAAAAAIATLLADPEMAGRMGREGRSLVRRKFSIERCADAYEEIYRECAAPGAAKEEGAWPTL